MNYNLHIQKILLETEVLPNPTDKLKLLKQAINIADANNDIDWGMELRIGLIYQELFLANTPESFPAFTWVLNTFDSNPDMFNEEDILLAYKWMSMMSYRHVSISAQQIESIFGDLRKRMNRNGFSDRVYYEALVGWMLFIGDLEKAEEYASLRNKEIFDRMSFETEDVTTICIEAIKGNMDKAVALANPYLSSKTTDKLSIIPPLSAIVFYLSRVGDKRAGEYFERLEEEFNKTDKYPCTLYELTSFFHYLAKNNRPKAWEYFETYSGWEVDAEDALSFDFSVAILPILTEDGQRQLTLSDKLPYYREDNLYHVRNLFDYYYAKADYLADRFDERNGNRHFRHQLNEAVKH